MTKARILKSTLAVAVLAGVSACATMEDQQATEMRLDELEKKVEAAMQNASTAKIDAATALHILTKN